MKRPSATTLVPLTILLPLALLAAAYTVPDQVQTMKVQVAKTFVFGDAILPAGEYRIVHDDAMKAAGEPCLSIWNAVDRGDAKHMEKRASWYCRRVPRRPSEGGNLDLRIKANGRYEVSEIQFPGTAVAHIPQSTPES